MRAARVSLVAAGLVVAGVGVALLVGTLRFDQLIGLAVWLVCAIVLHDGVLVPVTTVLGMALKRVGRPLPASAILLIEGGFAVGILVSLAVAPELYAQALGPRNATVLASDYGTRLIVVWAGIVIVVAAGVALLARRRHRVR